MPDKQERHIPLNVCLLYTSYVWDEYAVPCYNIAVDHPYYYHERLADLPKKYYHISIDLSLIHISGWTVSDMKALLASKPEGTQLFWGMDRTSALTALMSLGYNDFIKMCIRDRCLSPT